MPIEDTSSDFVGFVTLVAASVFDAFAAGSNAARRRHYEQLFEVVALPGETAVGAVLPGDVLLRRGEAGLGHAAVIASSGLWRHEQLPSMSLMPEGGRAGLYAQVIEGGAFPHASGDRFARLVAEAGGSVPYNQMILRPKRGALWSGTPSPSGSAFAPAAAAETGPRVCVVPANLFPPFPGQVPVPVPVPPQAPADPWATTDSTNNVLLHPVTPGTPRRGTLTADRSEKLLATPHVTVIVGPGATPLGVAHRLLPFYATAQPGNAPTAEELAKAILVYNTQFLPLEGMGNYRDGLCLPVPIEIDAQTGDWVLSADHARGLANNFPAASRPSLDRRPAHLTQPDPAAVRQEVEVFLRANTNAIARGLRLRKRLMRNPFEEVFFLFEMFRQLGAGALEGATGLMITLIDREVDLLSTLTAGNAILRRVRMLLTAPNIPQVSQPLVTRTLNIVNRALGVGAGLTRTVPRELPETALQLANRPRPPRGTPAPPGDPTRGRHRMVLGRDIFAGDVATETIGRTDFTGPAFIGRMPPVAFINNNRPLFAADRGDRRFQPRLDIVTAIAPNEGLLDAIRQRDAAHISTGIHQWSAHSEPELPGLLNRFKAASPDEFMLFFELYNLEVRARAGGFTLQRVNSDGSIADLPLNQRRAFFGGTSSGNVVSFTTEWAARTRAAAVASDNYRAAQVREAAARFDRIAREVGSLRVRLAGRGTVSRPLTQVITSQLGVAFILDAHINLPGHVPSDLQRAATDAGEQPDDATLDREITNRYAAIRRTFDTTARNRVIRGAGLDAAHGSFNGW